MQLILWPLVLINPCKERKHAPQYARALRIMFLDTCVR